MTDIYDEILALKEREDATILAHYYQEGEIQEIADITGDSLKLALSWQYYGTQGFRTQLEHAFTTAAPNSMTPVQVHVDTVGRALFCSRIEKY